MQRNTQTIHRNTDTIHRNTQIIHRNPKIIHRNTKTMHRNTQTMHGNTQTMHRNTDTIHRNTQTMHRNTQTMHRNTNNTQKHTNNTQKHTNNAQKYTNNTQKHTNNTQKHTNNTQKHTNNTQKHTNYTQNNLKNRWPQNWRERGVRLVIDLLSSNHVEISILHGNTQTLFFLKKNLKNRRPSNLLDRHWSFEGSIFLPWRWRQHVPPKHWYYRLYGITYYNCVIKDKFLFLLVGIALPPRLNDVPYLEYCFISTLWFIQHSSNVCSAVGRLYCRFIKYMLEIWSKLCCFSRSKIGLHIFFLPRYASSEMPYLLAASSVNKQRQTNNTCALLLRSEKIWKPKRNYLLTKLQDFLEKFRNDSSVCTATRVEVDRRGSNPDGGKIFRTHADWPWGKPSLL